MPQKNDLHSIMADGPFYDEFIQEAKEIIHTIDITPYLLDHSDLDNLYSDEGVYGGHFSKHGNSFVARTIYKDLDDSKLLVKRDV